MFLAPHALFPALYYFSHLPTPMSTPKNFLWVSLAQNQKNLSHTHFRDYSKSLILTTPSCLWRKFYQICLGFFKLGELLSEMVSFLIIPSFLSFFFLFEVSFSLSFCTKIIIIIIIIIILYVVVVSVIPTNTSRQELDEYAARMGAFMGY